jgi:AAA domain
VVMEDALLGAVLDRLGTSPLPQPAEELLLAALQGEGELADTVGQRPRPLPERPPRSAGEEDEPPVRAYLGAVTVEGFRGIGPPTVLRLEPGPGLTVVCGRNGSGKSTFAEALEVLLTGGLRRWEERSAVWREGWRCMHAPHARVSARLFVEGTAGPTTIERRWADDARDVGQSEAWVQRPRQARTTLATLGWGPAMSSYRPFLSHSELETLLAQPKDLYDQLNDLLGLDDLEKAAKRLAQARRDADQDVRAAKGGKEALVVALAASADPRAAGARELLAAKTVDLGPLEALASGAGAPAAEADVLAQLKTLKGSSLPGPVRRRRRPRWRG